MKKLFLSIALVVLGASMAYSAEIPVPKFKCGPWVVGVTETEMTIVYTLNGHEMTKNVPLATYGAWDAGNKYIYNFSIGANEIQFTCEVDPWTDVVVSGGNIAI